MQKLLCDPDFEGIQLHLERPRKFSRWYKKTGPRVSLSRINTSREAQVHIHIKKDENVLIVFVEGRIDTLTAPDFQARMEDLLDHGEKGLLIDLEKLEYVSSAGLRSILVTAKKAKSLGGCVSCCSLQDMVRKVFDISGFTKMIPVFDSLEDALKQ